MIFPFRMIANIDPTRTTTIRRQYEADIKRRFRKIFSIIKESIATNDCFGIDRTPQLSVQAAVPDVPPASHNQFNFDTDTKKIDEFMKWLVEQVEAGVFEMSTVERIGESIYPQWANVYLDHAYQKGIRRGRQELRNQGVDVPSFGDIPGADETTILFNQPIHADRIGVIYARNYAALRDITTSMDAQISRTLADGLAAGIGADQLARNVVDSVENMTLNRATLLARTEVINAHHKATVQEYRNAGIQGVKVKAEFSTAGDSRVCQRCKDLEKTKSGKTKIYTLDQIENLIPVHPQCRCVALPIVDEDDLEAVEPEPDQPFTTPRPITPPSPPPRPRPEPVEQIPAPQYNVHNGVVLDTAQKIRTAIVDTESDFYLSPRAIEINDALEESREEYYRLLRESVSSEEASSREVADKMKAQLKRQAKLEDDLRVEKSKFASGILNSPNNIRLNTNFELDKRVTARKEELRTLQKWINREGLELPKLNILPLSIEKRAYYINDYVFTTERDFHGVLSHEVGHFIDDNNADILQEAKDFRARRTQGKELELLGDGFHSDEYFLDGGFPNKYCGKVYDPDEATEIISMGLQFLMEDSFEFARKDPDYFDFIMRTIKELKR